MKEEQSNSVENMWKFDGNQRKSMRKYGNQSKFFEKNRRSWEVKRNFKKTSKHVMEKSTKNMKIIGESTNIGGSPTKIDGNLKSIEDL